MVAISSMSRGAPRRHSAPARTFTPRSLLRNSEDVNQREFFQSYHRLGSGLLGDGSTSIVYAVATRRPGADDDRHEDADELGCATSANSRRDELQAFACKDIVLDRYRLGCGGRSPEDICVELEIHAAMSVHPHIVRLHDFAVDRLTAKLVLELLPGGDLATRLAARGRFAEEEAREIMTKVLKAVGFMHQNNIVHRDIKLENILCADEREVTDVKVADLGMAVRLEGPAYTKELKMCGSPTYIAPEVITPTSIGPDGQKLSTYGAGADLWSCGVMLFTMLCGYPPFDLRMGFPHLFRQIKSGQIVMDGHPAWEHVSCGAKDFVRRLLTVDPSQRISAAKALSHQWLA